MDILREEIDSEGEVIEGEVLSHVVHQVCQRAVGQWSEQEQRRHVNVKVIRFTDDSDTIMNNNTKVLLYVCI